MAATRLLRASDQVVAQLVCSATRGGVDELVAALTVACAGRCGCSTARAGPGDGPADPGALLHPRGRGRPQAHRARGRGAARCAAELAAVRAALGVAADAVGQRLAENRLAVERDARLRMSLLPDLLHSSAEPDPGTRRRALDAGWQLEGWHAGIRVNVPDGIDPVTMRPEVGRAFEAAHLHALVVEQGRGWGVWTTFSEEPGPPSCSGTPRPVVSALLAAERDGRRQAVPRRRGPRADAR